MAGTSLLMLIDDIATILDDVSIMTKVAAKKAAGVLGDDLALNAQQVAGVKANRELPVVWAVAKGSMRNKLILVPSALAISAFAPWAVIPLLMLGGAYLCYEGFEKIAHKWLHQPAAVQAHHQHLVAALANTEVDMLAYEKDKIRGAIRTDFILSAEIMVITLGIAATASFAMQVAVLSSIALIMTVGVYGLVAGIVKLDDLGLYLSEKQGEHLLRKLQRSIGRGIVRVAPWMMKALSIIGTAAMFIVGGGILTHSIPWAQHTIEQLASQVSAWPAVGGVLHVLTPTVLDAFAGIVAGAAVLLLVTTAARAWQMLKGGAAKGA